MASFHDGNDARTRERERIEVVVVCVVGARKVFISWDARLGGLLRIVAFSICQEWDKYLNCQLFTART